MRCFYCGKRVSLVRKRSDADFCSDEHRRLYHARTRRSMDRLLEAEERLSISRRLNEGFPLRSGLSPQQGIPPERLLQREAGRLLEFAERPARLPVSRAVPPAGVEPSGHLRSAPPRHNPAASRRPPESPRWLAGPRSNVAPAPFRRAAGTALGACGHLAGREQPSRDIGSRSRICRAPEPDGPGRALWYPEGPRPALSSAVSEAAPAARLRQPMHAPAPAGPALVDQAPITAGARPGPRQAAILRGCVPAGEPVTSRPTGFRPPAGRLAIEILRDHRRRPLRPEVRISVPALAPGNAAGIQKTSLPRGLPCRQKQYPWESLGAEPARPRFPAPVSQPARLVPEAALRMELARAWAAALENRVAPALESLPDEAFHQPGFRLPHAPRVAQGLSRGRPVREELEASGGQPRNVRTSGWEAPGDSAAQPRFRRVARQIVSPQWPPGVAEALRASGPPEAEGNGTQPRACQAAFETPPPAPPARQRIAEAGLGGIAPAAALGAPWYQPASAGLRALGAAMRRAPLFPVVGRARPVPPEAPASPYSGQPKERSAQPRAGTPPAFAPDAAFRHPKAAGIPERKRILAQGPAVREHAAARDVVGVKDCGGWALLECPARGTGGIPAQDPRIHTAWPSASQPGLLALAAPASAARPANPAASEHEAPLAGPGPCWPAMLERTAPCLDGAAWLVLRDPRPSDFHVLLQEESISFAPLSVLPGASRPAAREWGKAAAADVEPVYEDFAQGLENWEGDLSGWQQDIAGVRPGSLALLRPTLPMGDYSFEFLGRIEARGIACVVRAADTENYYVVKIEAAQDGASRALTLVRYAVIGGKPEEPLHTPLALPASAHAPSKAQVLVEGNEFTFSLDGKPAVSWSEERLPQGGVGFFRQDEDRARLYWVKVSPLSEGRAGDLAPLVPPRSNLNFEVTMGV